MSCSPLQLEQAVDFSLQRSRPLVEQLVPRFHPHFAQMHKMKFVLFGFALMAFVSEKAVFL